MATLKILNVFFVDLAPYACGKPPAVRALKVPKLDHKSWRLTAGVMGVWLLLSGQPGTGMMESGSYPGIMGQAAMPGSMMGAPANRGIFGGYTGAVGLLMILFFIGLVGVLVYALLRERPGRKRQEK